jgi:hypothetical protein
MLHAGAEAAVDADVPFWQDSGRDGWPPHAAVITINFKQISVQQKNDAK